jgi:TatD DNase family protein
MSLIDSHCHLKTFVQKHTLDSVLSRAKNADVEKFITVGTSIQDWDCYQSLAQNNPDIFYSVGLHPCYVASDWVVDVEKIRYYWESNCKPVALGEIGLDYFHLPKDKKLSAENVYHQRQCFSKQLDLARLLDCPVIIHSRNSFEDCVNLIDQSGLEWERVVFHCFSEGEPQMKVISNRGGRASFTGNITYAGNDHMLEALKNQGVEKLMLETDSPYLCPEPFRKSKNEPYRVREILGFLESIFKDDYNQIEEISKINTEEFFMLNS